MPWTTCRRCDAGKRIFDGFKDHNGIQIKKALGGLPDEQVRQELSKVMWLFNKGLGGGARYAIGVDDDTMHVYNLTADGSGVELYSRPYDPETDTKMAVDFNDYKTSYV